MKAMTRGWAVVAVLSVGISACSKTDGSPTGAAGTATSASGGNAGGGAGNASAGSTAMSGGNAAAGTPSNGPAITSAPPAWQPPADCGGIGNLCPNLSGCAARSSCQLEGNVCIPALVPGATSLPAKSMERPYCAAYTCMTFDEASCFCTGPAGKQEPRCQSPSALAGLCQGLSSLCDADRPCCDGSSCVSHGSKLSTCEQTCSADSDCASGCCTDLYDTGSKICAKKAACDMPCKKAGEACVGSATMASNCCRGACNQSDNPDFAGCRPGCTTNADCPETGCCEPYANSNTGFCTKAIYCMCSAVGESCSPGKPDCCDGSVCAGFTPDTLTCFQKCTQASDCASGCCGKLSNSDVSICEGPEYCQ